MGILGALSSVKQLVIRLDEGNRPYVAGDEVSGTLEVTTEKESLKVDEITITVTGNISNEFEIRKSNDDKKKYRMNEKFWTHRVVLEGKTELAAGTKTYSFTFQLPLSLRSSILSSGSEKGILNSDQEKLCNLKIGKWKVFTNYKIEAVVDVPMGIDKDAELFFNVSHITDLNGEKRTQEKVEEQQTKTFGAFCCESRPVSINMMLNKSGFVCGEKIAIYTKVIEMYRLF